MDSFEDAIRICSGVFLDLSADLFADATRSFPGVFPDLSAESFPEVFAGVAGHRLRTYESRRRENDALK